MTQPPVIIVGGGFAGLTTAAALSRRHIPVKLIYDSGDTLAATPAAHGIATVKGILESDTFRFGQQLDGHAGFDKWLRSWETFLGVDRPANVWISGVDEMFQSRAKFTSEFGRVYRRDFVGAKRVEISQGERSSFVRARYPGDFWVDPSYVVEILWKVLRKSGATILDARVLKVGNENGEITFLLSTGETLRGSRAILCAGSRTPELITEIGMDARRWFAVAGYTFKARSESLDGCLVKKTSGLTVRTKTLHWGSTSDKASDLSSCSQPSRFRSEADELIIARENLAEITQEIKPENWRDIEIRWGVRIRTKSRSPVVERVLPLGKGGLWINCGYYKSGLVLSWMLAEDLAEEILKLKSTDAERPYFSSH